MVPANVAGADGVVGHSIEGHLLYVKVSIKEKAPAIHHKKREENGEGEPQAQQEGF